MDRSVLRVPLCLALLGAGAAAHAAVMPGAVATPAASSTTIGTPVPPPPKSPKTARILKAMQHASTRGHPDLFGEFAGMRHLFDGDYAQALKYFKIGARYADKFSQYSIGMMYLKGRGVRKDPATACAWLALAAERKYPKFVRAHDVLCAALTPAQRDRAAAVLDTLLPEYGDKVAKPRMALALANDRRALTGSHTGYDFGVISAAPPGHADSGADCGDVVLHIGGVGIPSSCGRYNAALLRPKLYFQARDAQFNGTVTVGALQNTNAPASGTRGASSDGKPQPAAASSAGPR